MPTDLVIPPQVSEAEAEKKGLKSFCLQMSIQYYQSRPGMANGKTLTDLAEHFEEYMKGGK